MKEPTIHNKELGVTAKPAIDELTMPEGDLDGFYNDNNLKYISSTKGGQLLRLTAFSVNTSFPFTFDT